MKQEEKQLVVFLWSPPISLQPSPDRLYRYIPVAIELQTPLYRVCLPAGEPRKVEIGRTAGASFPVGRRYKPS